MTTETPRSLTWRVVLVLLVLALPGVAAMSWLALPLLVDASQLPVQLQVLQIVSALQSLVLVLIAALVGATLAPRTGLSSPAIQALVGGGNVREAMRPQVVPGLLGGAAGALILVVFHAFAPESLQAIQPATPLPLVVRVLYGGITEEVLVRWGLMTWLAWAGWRLLQGKRPQPSAVVLWAAIALSAGVFGLSHLPAVAQAVPSMSAGLVLYVTLGNALFGLVAGSLYWRFGLEAAILAHVTAHLLASAVLG